MTNEPLEFGIPIYLPRTEALDLGVKYKGIIWTKKNKNKNKQTDDLRINDKENKYIDCVCVCLIEGV